VAILAGDFMLARASVSLASLRNTEIVELLSLVLEHLVSGEIMQLTADKTPHQGADLDFYLQKTYCKTASLMANSCRAVATLAGAGPAVSEQAWSYGRHVGLAFQIVDDLLDLTGSSSILGKPALNDLKSGLATAPVLLAARQRPELLPLIARKFRGEGDVAAALALVQQGGGLQAARDLAAQHCRLAADTILALPPAASDHAAISRQALIQITSRVLNRSK
jgi:geranyl diphosphate synthase